MLDTWHKAVAAPSVYAAPTAAECLLCRLVRQRATADVHRISWHMIVLRVSCACLQQQGTMATEVLRNAPWAVDLALHSAYDAVHPLEGLDPESRLLRRVTAGCPVCGCARTDHIL